MNQGGGIREGGGGRGGGARGRGSQPAAVNAKDRPNGKTSQCRNMTHKRQLLVVSLKNEV